MWASRSLQLNGTYGYFFAVYGLFSELAEGAERALVIDLVPDEWRGRALGAYRAAVGIAMLSASMAFGVIYEYAGAKPAFILGAVLALTPFRFCRLKARTTAENSFAGKLMEAAGFSLA